MKKKSKKPVKKFNRKVLGNLLGLNKKPMKAKKVAKIKKKQQKMLRK